MYYIMYQKLKIGEIFVLSIIWECKILFFVGKLTISIYKYNKKLKTLFIYMTKHYHYYINIFFNLYNKRLILL